MNPCLNLYRTIILSVFPGLDLDETIEKHKDEYIIKRMPEFGRNKEIWSKDEYIELLEKYYDNADFIIIDPEEETRRLVRKNMFKFYML